MMRQGLSICNIKGDWYDAKKYIEDGFGKPDICGYIRDTDGSIRAEVELLRQSDTDKGTGILQIKSILRGVRREKLVILDQ